MLVKLIDRDLIRRYGPSIQKVDDSMGVVLIKHNKAYEVDRSGNKVENKNKMMREYFDKMIKGAPIDKDVDNCIFPEICFS